MAKRVLLTGADGFIGSHLVEKLVREGYDVRAFVYYNSLGTWGWLEQTSLDVRNDLDVVAGDIRDHHCVKNAMKDCEAVLHLAALIAIPYSYGAAQSYVDTNITGTLNVMQSARECNVRRVIHTSTSEVYGSARFVPITEEHPLSAQSPYAASKIAADQIALSFFCSFDLPVIVLRPFNTYGPRQSARAVIPTIVTQLLEGDGQLKLGSRHPTRDFSYVEDTVAGFLSALEYEGDSALGHVINIGSGFEISVGETAELVAELIGCDLEIREEEERFRPEKSEVDRLLCSNDKAKDILSWSPNLGGREGLCIGLGKTIDWFSDKSNLQLYKSGIYNI